MVHALSEAHRVLKPGGILVDLRPAPAHRQIGLGAGRTWQPVAALQEQLDDDYAANGAVASVVGLGLFKPERRKRFVLDRVMDSVEELRDFIADFDTRRDLPSQAPLVDRLERRYRKQRRPGKVAVRGPMHLGVLRKTSAATRGQTGAKMIIAILPNSSAAESLLNNLSEADFDLQYVSVIMKNTGLRDKIAKDTGPLVHAAPAELGAGLRALGTADEAARRAQDAVDNDKVVVAMDVDPKYEAAAREMFQDVSAQLL